MVQTRVPEFREADLELEEENEATSDDDLKCECGSSDISTHTNEKFCRDCGLVIEEDNIDRGPEWRAFNAQEEEEKSRVGSPTTQKMHDRGLTTVMGNINTSNMSRRRKEQLERLREWDKRAKQDSKERGLKYALGEINRMVSALELPDSIHVSAANIFRGIHDDDLVQGRSFEGMVGGSIYIACRQDNFARTFEEISEVSRVEKQDIYRSYKKIIRHTDIQVAPPDPQDFVARFLRIIQDETDISSMQLEGCTRTIIRETKGTGVQSGKDPKTVVGGAIYLAAQKMGIDVDQSHICHPLDISPTAIRRMYQDQAEELGIEIDFSGSTGKRMWSVEGIGSVPGRRRKELAEMLQSQYYDDVEQSDRFDFVLNNRVAIDWTDEDQSQKPTSMTHVVIATEGVEHAPCDYGLLDDQVDKQIIARFEDLA